MSEARSIHTDLRGEHSSFVFTGAGDLNFALRTTVAGIAALFVAMWLQLDTPRWAIWTVFIVSPPLRGNACARRSRIIGTFLGCVVGVVSVGLFPQDRVGFYVAFSAWLGACAFGRRCGGDTYHMPRAWRRSLRRLLQRTFPAHRSMYGRMRWIADRQRFWGFSLHYWRRTSRQEAMMFPAISPSASALWRLICWTGA